MTSGISVERTMSSEGPILPALQFGRMAASCHAPNILFSGPSLNKKAGSGEEPACDKRYITHGSPRDRAHAETQDSFSEPLMRSTNGAEWCSTLNYTMDVVRWTLLDAITPELYTVARLRKCINNEQLRKL